MSSSALSAQGMTIEVSEGSPTAFSVIPEVRSLGGPSGSATILDATDLSSTGKEFKTGLKDEGELSMEIFYRPDNTVHARLRDYFSTSTTGAFRLSFTDTAPTVKWYFSAIVSGFAVSGAVDTLLTATVTLKITGAITETTT
jgi:hypothetical protein